MAENTLTVKRSSGNTLADVTPTSGNSDGSKFLNDGNTLLWLSTSAMDPVVATVVSVPCSHGRTKDQVFSCLASKSYLLGPFDPVLFNDSDGFAHVIFDSVVGLTVSAVSKG